MKLLLIFIIILSSSVFSQSLEFKRNGKLVLSLKRSEILKNEIKVNDEYVGSVDKTLFNVFRGYERTYRGFSLYELLDKVYGKKWREYRVISFYALDGYKQIANISKMLKSSKNKNGYIAYKETAKESFSTYYKKGKKVELGPYYLVWSNFSEKDKASHGDNLKWPYQLKTIEISK